MEVSLGNTLVVPERHSRAASYWFSQAGCHLIDLVICAYVDPSMDPSWHFGPNERYFANFMLQLVRPQAERIRRLCLAFRDLYDICCLLQYQDDKDALPHHVWSFPNLEYLTLNLDPDYCVAGAELIALESMPRLHTVVLYYAILSNELNIHLPWSQLTSLTICTLRESVFRVLMTQCPALENGCFSIGDSKFEELPTIDITLTRLTTFNIQFDGASDP